METPCWCPSEGHQHGNRGEHYYVIEFCYESVNSSLEKLINTISNVLLLHFSDSITPQNVTLSYMTALPAARERPRHVKG